jgi:hypothetical protein
MLQDKYRTACGGVIVLPPKTKEHLTAHPEVGGLLDEVCSLVRLPGNGEFLAAEIDLGRILGRSGCTPAAHIGDSERATFAVRVGRPRPSRVAVGVEGPESSTVAVLAFAGRNPGEYILITSFVGGLATKEPWDQSLVPGTEEAVAALDFWCRHALVHDPSVMGEVFESTWADILAGV